MSAARTVPVRVCLPDGWHTLRPAEVRAFAATCAEAVRNPALPHAIRCRAALRWLIVARRGTFEGLVVDIDRERTRKHSLMPA